MLAKVINYTFENTELVIRMDNPEKQATIVTQNEEKQNKNTTQYVLDITIRKHKNIVLSIINYFR